MLTLAADIDVRIPMRDGHALVADVFRPHASGNYPVIVTVGPYGKDLLFHEFNPEVYAKCPNKSPYMVWETPDPAWWVHRGYVIVRADQRGMRKTPGLLTLHLQPELDDLHDAIEWAGEQPWSNGKVGLSGVSYFAFIQWQIAAQKPEHLTAIIPWEGFSDFYREEQRQGGIFCNGFVDDRWYALRIIQGQHGKGLAGEPRLDESELKRNRAFELPEFVRDNELEVDTYREMSADLSKITLPVYSSGNWGGMSLHGRGCIQGYLKSNSEFKWLEMHCGNFVYSYYGDEGLETQLRFFDYWLKGVDNGLLSTRRIKLAIRNGAGRSFYWRFEDEWPLARTQWTTLFLNAASMTMVPSKEHPATSVSYTGKLGLAEFRTAPFNEATEITGPLKAKLWISSSTNDTDLFVDIRQIDANGNEVMVETTYAAAGPIAKGWLRASHRKTDPHRSLPWQPHHTHDELQKLTPGEIVPLEVEIWPTSMVFPKGSSLVLSVSAVDGKVPGQFYHTDPADRPAEVFINGTYTLHTGCEYDAHLLLPIVPAVRK